MIIRVLIGKALLWFIRSTPREEQFSQIATTGPMTPFIYDRSRLRSSLDDRQFDQE